MAAACDEPGAPLNLRCEYQPRPLGIDVRVPRLSWELADGRRGARQTAYRVLVASSAEGLRNGLCDVWDTGVVASERSFHVEYGGPELRPFRRYWWTVRTWDAAGRPSPCAAPAWWEMGPLRGADWAARWISTPADPTAGGPERGPCRAQLLRREFDVASGLRRARLYVSGLGCFELHLNGRPVSADVFAPDWTKYEARIQYRAYDVTVLLRPGCNALGAVLGNGWWAGGLSMGRGKIERVSEGNLRLILMLRLEYEDGRAEVVATDGAWRARAAPIVENTLYHGEIYDARLEQPGWDRAGFDDAGWGPVVVLEDAADRLVAQACEPIRVTDELPGVGVTQPEPGLWIFDFGQNLAGRCRLRVRGPAGTRVRLRFAETLTPDGQLDRRNLVGARATDVYVLRGGEEETWEPRFTYHGFRYVEVTGWPGEPRPDALTARVLHTAAAPAGEFACSSALLNQIQHNIVWAQRSNLMSVPTDCPQRDERLGWLGDAHLFAPTACWNMELAAFFAKWLTDIRDSQAADGAIADVAPLAVLRGPAAPGWGDAIAGVPWTLLRYYGDVRAVAANYAALRAWVEYMRARAPGHLYACPHQVREHGYGDWVAPVESPRAPIAVAFYYYSTRRLAELAGVLGRADDAAEYTRLAGEIRAAFNAAYFDPGTASYLGGTQAANILPLALGLVPDERRAAVLANVARDIELRGAHLSTGFLATAFALPLLSTGGYHELACHVAQQTSYPSWGHMVACGATTMCELWNPDTGDPRMNSWNHFALGTVGQWLFEHVAGLALEPEACGPAPLAGGVPAGPDFSWGRRFVIRPRPGGGLTWARARWDSLCGPVLCHWTLGDGALGVGVLIPPNARARICVPTMGWPDWELTESGRVIGRGGAPVGAVDGLTWHGSTTGGQVELEACAGSYSFGLHAGGGR